MTWLWLESMTFSLVLAVTQSLIWAELCESITVTGSSRSSLKKNFVKLALFQSNWRKNVQSNLVEIRNHLIKACWSANTLQLTSTSVWLLCKITCGGTKTNFGAKLVSSVMGFPIVVFTKNIKVRQKMQTIIQWLGVIFARLFSLRIRYRLCNEFR